MLDSGGVFAQSMERFQWSINKWIQYKRSLVFVKIFQYICCRVYLFLCTNGQVSQITI